LRSQFVTSNLDKKGLRYAPMVFYRARIRMLSSVLNSDSEIPVNIRIIRIFTKIRDLLSDSLNLRLEV